jgi:hypothetical protein
MVHEPETGDFEVDCESGCRLADAVSAYAIDNDYPPAFQQIDALLPRSARKVGWTHRVIYLVFGIATDLAPWSGSASAQAGDDPAMKLKSALGLI